MVVETMHAQVSEIHLEKDGEFISAKRNSLFTDTRQKLKTPTNKAYRSNLAALLSIAKGHSNGDFKFQSTSQARNRISRAGDKYEHEADRVAEQIIHMPKPPAVIGSSISNLAIQSKNHLLRSDCKKDLRLQRLNERVEQHETKEIFGSRRHVIPHMAHQIYRPQGTGEAISESVRSFFETRFGYDLRNLRVHTNSHASHIAKALNAKAFTVGSDIIFGSGMYSPTTWQGKQLLAHEIVHVIQQSRHSPSYPYCKTTNSLNNNGDSNAHQRMVQQAEFPVATRTDYGQTPDIQCRLIVAGTNEFDTRSFFRRHEFSNYRLVDLGAPGILIDVAGSTRPHELEQEIYWSLAQGNGEHTRTLEQLRREINFRRSVVNAAITLASIQRQLGISTESRFGQFSEIQSGTGHGTRLNPRYWILDRQEVGEGEYEVVMLTRSDVRPSSAIEDIWRHPERYAYECFTSVTFIQYKALLRREGANEFDRHFASGLVLRWSAHGGPGEIILDLEQLGLEEIDVGATNNYVDLIPGDQTFFRGSTGFVENTIYLGRGQYFSHPLGIITDLSEITAYYGGWILPLTLSQYRYRWNV